MQDDENGAGLTRTVYEAVARPELFEDILADVARTIESGNAQRLQPIRPAFARAYDTLSRLSLSEPTHDGSAALRFLLSAEGTVLDVSATAASELIVAPGMALADLLAPAARESFERVARRDVAQSMIAAPLLEYGKPVLLLLRAASDKWVEATAMLVRWQPEADAALREGFALSAAEADIVRLLFDGASPKEIAIRRSRSIETIRSQIRSILGKTGVRGLTDLTHLAYALVTSAERAQTSDMGHRRIVRLADGRGYDVSVTGPRNGEPLLFLHGCLGGRRLPAVAREALQDRCLIAPGRPGHGQTDRLQEKELDPCGVCRDLIDVLDRLGVPTTDILAYDTGVAFALTLAQMAPDRIGRVSVVSAVPPMPGLRDLMSLPLQQRVFPLIVRSSREAATYLARLGGERLLRDGPSRFAGTVFAGAPVDLDACMADTEVSELFWRGHAWHVEQGPHGFVSDMALVASDWAASLSELTTPVTFIHGERDTSAPLKLIENLRQRTGGQIRLVKDRGHALLHAGPADWSALI